MVNTADQAHCIVWKRNGWLAPYLPEDVAEHFAKHYYDADGLHVTTRMLVSPLGYNTNMVKAEEAPKSFADLLDPKWAGKMIKAHPAYSGTIMNATFQIARDLGWDYLEKLAKQRVMQVQSATDTPKKLALGERAVMVDGAGYLVIQYKEKGDPVEIVYPAEGTPLATAPERGVQGRAQSQCGAPVPELDARARGPADPRRLRPPVFAARPDGGKAGRAPARRHQADEGGSGGRGEERRGHQAALHADFQDLTGGSHRDHRTAQGIGASGETFRSISRRRSCSLFVALLCVLVILPISWLVYYSLVDRSRRASRSPTSASCSPIRTSSSR